MSTLTPVLTVEALDSFLGVVFPQIQAHGDNYKLLEINPGEVKLALDPADAHIRPGGTISGPALFTLCDYAAYDAILAHIGEIPLTVTTNMSINFLNKADLGRIICTATILKLGKRLAVVECHVRDKNGLLIAQADATYSIPPRK